MSSRAFIEIESEYQDEEQPRLTILADCGGFSITVGKSVAYIYSEDALTVIRFLAAFREDY